MGLRTGGAGSVCTGGGVEGAVERAAEWIGEGRAEAREAAAAEEADIRKGVLRTGTERFVTVGLPESCVMIK